MAKKVKRKLKQTAVFGGKKYDAFDITFKTKEDAVKKAKELKNRGYNVIRDKRSVGHFLWVRDSGKIKNLFAQSYSEAQKKIQTEKEKYHYKSSASSYDADIIEDKFTDLACELGNNKDIPILLRMDDGFGDHLWKKDKERYKKLSKYKELEKKRREALKLRTWLWGNGRDEAMVTDYRWLGRWRRPSGEQLHKLDNYIKKKYKLKSL